MTDLTPETLAAWREDAEYGDAVNAPEVADERILALLNGLEAAERKYADLVAAVRRIADDADRRGQESLSRDFNGNPWPTPIYPNDLRALIGGDQ